MSTLTKWAESLRPQFRCDDLPFGFGDFEDEEKRYMEICVEAIREHPGKMAVEIKHITGLHRDIVNVAIRRAQREGLVRAVKKKTNNFYYLLDKK